MLEDREDAEVDHRRRPADQQVGEEPLDEARAPAGQPLSDGEDLIDQRPARVIVALA